MRWRPAPNTPLPAVSRIRVAVTLVVVVVVCLVLVAGSLLERSLEGPVRQWAETRATSIAAQAIVSAVGNALGTTRGTDLVRPLGHGGDGSQGLTYAWQELLRIKLAIAGEMAKGLENMSSEIIRVPLGELTGLTVMAGSGPTVPVRIVPVGTATTDLRFDFQARGINQVLHRIYVEVQVRIRIIAPFQGVEVVVQEQIPIATELIQGQVPDTVIQWSGDLEELLRGKPPYWSTDLH